jgi:glycosyltransferase involved in cell wall biosynthesis
MDDVVAAGVGVIRLDRTRKLALGKWWPLISFLRSRRVDVLHAHKFGSNLWGAIIGPLAGVPVVIAHEHSWSFEGQPVRRFLDREVIARGANVIVAVSREDRRRMIEVVGLDPGKVLVVHNGVPRFAAADGRRVRNELGIPCDAPVVGSIGIKTPKTPAVLIEAVAALRGEFPEIRLLLVGRGDQENALQTMVGESGLESTVHLLGWRTDIADILAALDVAVLTSLSEGSPLAVMEYMAAGKPVVASRVGGIPDLIDHGVHGLLVQPRSVRELADALAMLLRDPDLRATMGARARARQEAEFDTDSMIARFERLYADLLQGRTAQA